MTVARIAFFASRAWNTVVFVIIAPAAMLAKVKGVVSHLAVQINPMINEQTHVYRRGRSASIPISACLFVIRDDAEEHIETPRMIGLIRSWQKTPFINVMRSGVKIEDGADGKIGLDEVDDCRICPERKGLFSKQIRYSEGPHP